MKTKTIVTSIVAITLLGAGTFLALHHFSIAHSIPGEVIPIKFDNDSFLLNGNDQFTVEIDSKTKRTPDSSPTGHIKSTVAPSDSSSADFLASLNGGGKPLQANMAVRYDVNEHSALLGKRIRVSGWMKTSDVRNWAGATLGIFSKDMHVFADDDMCARAVHGTTDWQQIEFVTDIPTEPCMIYLAPALYGTGEIWTDGFQIEITSPYAAITDDRKWHFWSQTPNDYSVETNSALLHEGHRTLCLTYLPGTPAPKGSWMWWGQDIRDPEKYRGHTVRMTVWTKSEDVADSAGPNLRPKGANFKVLASDGQSGHHPIHGTTDWTQRTITCVIPAKTQCLDTGIYFGGSGKVWVDMQSLKYEIAK